MKPRIAPSSRAGGTMIATVTAITIAVLVVAAADGAVVEDTLLLDAGGAAINISASVGTGGR